MFETTLKVLASVLHVLVEAALKVIAGMLKGSSPFAKLVRTSSMFGCIRAQISRSDWGLRYGMINSIFSY